MLRSIKPLPFIKGNKLTLSNASKVNWAIRKRFLVNEPKYDDAAILAKDVNFKEFKSTRNSKNNHSISETSNEQKEVTLQRMKLLQFGGLGFIAIVGVSIGTFYYLFDKRQKEKALKDDLEWNKLTTSSKNKKQKTKKKKTSKSKPFVSVDQPDSSVPGLYYWGLDTSKDDQWQCIPKRIPLFDNKILRDVCFVNQSVNFIIDDTGDLFNWNQCDNQLNLILKNQNLVSVKESNNCGYTLNSKGEMLVLPIDKIAELPCFIKSVKRVGFLPKIPKLNEYKTYELKLDTTNLFDKRLGEDRINQFDTGTHHLLLVSNAGKAYSCSTGYTSEKDQTIKSKGQFGIPSLSQFDTYPENNKLYEIELLNKSLSQRKKKNNITQVAFRDIVKVACGDSHSMAIDNTGNIFAFGWNRYGQLGLPISYENENVSYPKKISMYGFVPFFNTDSKDNLENDESDDEDEINNTRGNFATSQDQRFNLTCMDINCCKETSYMTVKNGLDQLKYFSFGNGSNGELGNSTYKNSQFHPTRVKLDDNDILQNWITNKDCNHVIRVSAKGTVNGWGLNNVGQIGNWQKGKFKFSKPEDLPLLIEPGVKYETNVNVSTLPLLEIENDKQKISVGKDSSCLYWTKK